MRYSASNLLIRPNPSPASSLHLRITPALAGWDFITFESHRLAGGSAISGDTGTNEMALVMLGGMVEVQSSVGNWRVGGRHNVFEGRPHALYLSRNAQYTLTATNDAELALAWAPAERDFPARLIQPEDCAVEIRGGDNATRQINSIIPPGFPCQRLVVVEVVTPGGNWSSYPPHKHDVHRTDDNGSIIEADLEEVYFYKLDKPEGFAVQRIYTDDASPLQRAGEPIDEVVMAHDGDAVIVPEGYHPVASPPGYTTYYLNVLAGSAQSLANFEDPNHAWVKQTYKTRDPRIPVYKVSGH
jgi:5-deoxy-glucuronate isomerase